MIELKPCPFCGHEFDPNDLDDTLYPAGMGWIDHPDGIREYKFHASVPPEQWCWQINCQTHQSGCGANITGDSKQEVIDAWNRRSNRL